MAESSDTKDIPSNEVPEAKPATLGRRLSRRLSIITKVPSMLNTKLKQEIFNGGSDNYLTDKKYFDVTVIAPDKTQRIIPCQRGQRIIHAMSSIMEEFALTDPKLYLAGSLAAVDAEADIIFLFDNILIIEEPQIPPEKDSQTEKFICDEREYIRAMCSAGELFDNPLIRNCDDSYDLSLIFQSLNNVANECNCLLNDLKSALTSENISAREICCYFNDKFWDEYDDYLRNYRRLKRLLRQKKAQDENFVQICRLRQGAAKYSLEQIVDLPVQRLSEYERYFETLLAESRLENQCNVEEINKAKTKCKQAAKRGQRESDLERIQDLFPNDCLRLYDADALTMKVKGLMRKRSGAAARLQRALSTKSLRSESPPSQKTPLSSFEQRTFLMEAPVQFSSGVQSQDRHLFLFNDLLLVAKPRSGGNFKLKEKVRISEIWLTKCCLDDVSELNKSEDTSFVIGWPTTNLVVTFSTQAARDLWWNKFLEVFRNENEKEPCSTNIQVVFYDVSTNIEYCKTFSVGPEETARDCIKLALEHLEMRNLDHNNFQLWAKTARDESPYPLIGHERPFAIKLSCLRDSLSSEDGFDLDHCNNIHDPVARCHFILRNNVKSSVTESKKNNKKANSRGVKIGHVFRRSLKDQSACLFGLPLCKLMDGETLPKPIMSMLYQVFAKGPFMQGIFRKSANARLVRELRDKLDTGEDVTWEHVPVLVTAALLKDFLRSLPEPLLTTALYTQWRSALEAPNLNTKLYRMKGVLAQLPKPNHLLLIHFLCVLYHIARRSCHTLMSAANLGVCVGPSLLWSDCPNVGDDLRIVPSVVECLITHCEFLCGSHVPSLLGDLRDSGTEESDSMKRDDSSIDSLECSPPPRKDKMSLSRDSGLTMSDSQLYTPDEEESESTSSSGYDPAFESHAKVSSSISMPVNYVRVYGGWEERLNPNYFQRQAWFRQRSRRMNSLAANKNDVRRTASEESLLDSSSDPPPAPPRRNKVHEYAQTPPYPCKNSMMKPRRLEVTLKNAESDTDRSNVVENDSSTYVHVNYRKESNAQSAVPSAENFMLERRSLPLNSLTTKCENSGNVSSHQKINENHYSNVCLNSSAPNRLEDSGAITFGSGDYYYAVCEQIEEVKNLECEDSSTLSDEDCTPHVSRSNSRGNEVVTKLRYSPAVHSETCVIRGRVKRKEELATHRSRSLPPPPPYRPPPPATSRRAPITSYYLGDCNQMPKYVIRTYKDEESYV